MHAKKEEHNTKENVYVKIKQKQETCAVLP